MDSTIFSSKQAAALNSKEILLKLFTTRVLPVSKKLTSSKIELKCWNNHFGECECAMHMCKIVVKITNVYECKVEKFRLHIFLCD